MKHHGQRRRLVGGRGWDGVRAAVIACVPTAIGVIAPPAAVLMCLSSTTECAAQPVDYAGTPLVRMDLQDAMNKSAGESRLLVVVPAGNLGQARADATTWRNAALVEWARRFAVVVHVDDVEMVRTLYAGGLRFGDGEQPLVFRNGKQVRLFGTALPANATRLKLGPRPGGALAAAERAESVRLPLLLEWTRRGEGREDAAWLAASDAAGRAAGADGGAGPARRGAEEPLSQRATDSAGQVIAAKIDPVPADATPAQRLAAVLDRLAEARREAEAGKEQSQPGEQSLRRAVGLYTWLWEATAAPGRAALDGDAEAVEGLGLFVLAPELERFARSHAPMRARMLQVRRAGFPRVTVMEYPEFAAWLMAVRLADAEKNGAAVLEFLDAALSDVDAGAVLPRGDRAALELILPRLAPMDPLLFPTTGRDPARYVRNLAARAAEAPKGWSKEEFERFATLAKWWREWEIARLHAALLAAGREEDAFTLLDGAMAEEKSRAGALLLRVSIAALAADVARAGHAERLRASPAAADPRAAVVLERLPKGP